MDKLEVLGGNKLKGHIKISGSKNASLPILASSILFDEEVEIYNLPNVKDIDTMLNLLRSLGLQIKRNKSKKSVIISKSKKIKTATINYLINHAKSFVFFGLGIYWTAIVLSTFFSS